MGLPVLAGISCITGALIGAHCEFYLRDMKDLRLITVRCVVEGWLRWTIGSQIKTHKLGFHFRHSIRTLEKCLEHKKSLCYGRVWRVKLATQYTHDPRDGWGWIEESIGFNLDRGPLSHEARERWSEMGIRLPENCPPSLYNTEVDLHFPTLVNNNSKDWLETWIARQTTQRALDRRRYSHESHEHLKVHKRDFSR